LKALEMARAARHPEHHAVERLGWLRAAVLGANDGLLSTASLIIGVASASGTHKSILIAGISGLVAGAMSMAAGEYVSVSSQADSEEADLTREQGELRDNRDGEVKELAAIYRKRGLDQDLAMRVSKQLMARDALGAHARDELGISATMTARPIQAALASAASFSVGLPFRWLWRWSCRMTWYRRLSASRRCCFLRFWVPWGRRRAGHP
jgi:VIT1/CCC1 family predicted Fe2+/Mn2+ transporter